MLRKISFWEAVATIIGGTVGAGLLAIPYAILQSGFTIGFFLIIVIAIVSILLNVMLSYILLRTRQNHQLPGLVGTYLGSFIQKLTFITLAIGSYGALLAFIIGEGQVLSALFGKTPLLWSLLFFVVGSIAVFLGITFIKKIMVVMVIVICGILGLLSITSWHLVSMQNLATIHAPGWIIPYGVLLFAFSGTYGVLNARQELKGQEKYLPLAIVFAGIIIAFIYAFFTFFTLGVTGIETTEVATIGLGAKLGPYVNIFGNLIAVLTMGTCFISVGYGLTQMYIQDFKKSRTTSLLYVIIIPLLLFFSGVHDFISIIALSGGVLIGLNSIILVFAFWNAREFGNRESEFHLGRMHIIGFLLLFLFALGMYLSLV